MELLKTDQCNTLIEAHFNQSQKVLSKDPQKYQ